ncbi:MAG: ABC transporter substrate-binding protein [Candidatus Limnocylindria bacterium]
MTRISTRSLLAGLCAGALVLAACTPGATPGQPAEEVSFELRVGNLLSFTGDLAPFGPPIDRATELAVEVITEALEAKGLSDRISVSVVASEDDQTQAAAGVEAATKLAQVDQVHVIMGALASGVTIPVAESVAIPNQIVLISPASTSPAISDMADDGFVWRTAPSDALQGKVLANAVAEAFGADATINTGTRNDAYGVALIGEFEEAWKAGGGTIGQSVQWNPDAATFDSEAGQLGQGSPDGWVIIDFPQTFAKVGPALVRAGGWDPARTFTADGLRDATLPDTVGEEATEGMRGTAPTSEEAPAGAAFQTLWDDRVGDDRGTFDAHAFDAVVVAFLAALAAGSSDPSDIRDALQDVSGPGGNEYTFEQLGEAIDDLLAGRDIDYQGAAGPLDFDENGDPGASNYEVWQFSGGEVETTEVIPFSAE